MQLIDRAGSQSVVPVPSILTGELHSIPEVGPAPISPGKDLSARSRPMDRKKDAGKGYHKESPINALSEKSKRLKARSFD
uniref:Uncharacterized protein n=1 Tax=Utricularia reniformis TaxID=192314 RepID=A0A1Y0B4Q4_9LAMI|nr:hypothetical protein AEK19_MT2224 [Utricularia reniformis]ART32370.1 hypothetical protein AEK19_MT2224 [Utricularia reniformis]